MDKQGVWRLVEARSLILVSVCICVCARAHACMQAISKCKYSEIYMWCGGKQWQTIPKNLPSMQRTRAIPVAWLGSGSCPN